MGCVRVPVGKGGGDMPFPLNQLVKSYKNSKGEMTGEMKIYARALLQKESCFC